MSVWQRSRGGFYIPRRTTKFTASLRALGIEASSQTIVPPASGIPLAWVLGLGEIFHMHPWIWMEQKYIQTLSFVVSGGKGGGKTVLAKLLIYYILMLAQGENRGNAIYDNMRNDLDEPEDQFFMDFFGDQAGRISVNEARINPYDHRLGFSRETMLRWTLTMIYDLTGKQFEGYEINILSAMMRKVLERDPALLNPGMTAQAVGQFRYQDYEDFMARHRRELAAELGGDLGEAHGESLLRTILTVDNANTAVELASRHDKVIIEQSAARLADLLIAVLLEGLSGKVFGDTTSLPALIDGKVYVSQDMTGLDPALASAYHYLTRLYTAGRFAIIMQDETSKSWQYRSWANAEADQEWQIRGQNPMIVRILQELAQLETVGDDGAQNVKQAVTSIRGAGAHFIMPGQSRPAYRQLQQLLGFGDLDLAWLLGLDPNQPGFFGFKTRGENSPFLACQLPLIGEVETQLAASNKSLRNRLTRYHYHNMAVAAARARVEAREREQQLEINRRKALVTT